MIKCDTRHIPNSDFIQPLCGVPVRMVPMYPPDAGVGSVTGNLNLHVLRFEKKSDVTTYILGLCISVIQIDLCNKVKVSCPTARWEIFKLDTIFKTFRSRMRNLIRQRTTSS